MNDLLNHLRGQHHGLDRGYGLDGEFRRVLFLAHVEGLLAVVLEAEGVPIVSQEPGTSETQARRPDSAYLRTSSQSRGGFMFQ